MNKYTDLFKQADASFNAESNFKEALAQLKGLSDDELSQITPSTFDKEVYQKLIVIVEDAIDKNISQAELVAKVKELGQTAERIVKRVPAIAGLF